MWKVLQVEAQNETLQGSLIIVSKVIHYHHPTFTATLIQTTWSLPGIFFTDHPMLRLLRHSLTHQQHFTLNLIHIFSSVRGRCRSYKGNLYSTSLTWLRISSCFLYMFPASDASHKVNKMSHWPVKTPEIQCLKITSLIRESAKSNMRKRHQIVSMLWQQRCFRFHQDSNDEEI